MLIKITVETNIIPGTYHLINFQPERGHLSIHLTHHDLTRFDFRRVSTLDVGFQLKREPSEFLRSSDYEVGWGDEILWLKWLTAHVGV